MGPDMEFLERIMGAARGAIERIVRRKAEQLHASPDATNVVERAAQYRAQARRLLRFDVRRVHESNSTTITCKCEAESIPQARV